MKRTGYNTGHMNVLFSRLFIILSFLAPAGFSAALPDIRGSQDHPLISRYPDSRILQYKVVDFDAYALPTAVENKRPSKSLPLKGKVTKIYYQNPKGRSTLEIFSNFDDALKKNGFQDVFSCTGPGCGAGAHWTAFNETQVSGSGDAMRYKAARLEKNGAQVHVAVMVSADGTSLHIIEGKTMESGLVAIDASAMAESIDRDGHVSLYAIYFDTDKSVLKPESDSALQQIAALLGNRPALKLHVVGHTDNTGGLAHNMKLSNDRAAAVVTALTTRHKIAASRLMPHGVGPLAPVTANTIEEGRAKNRRVDLVAQ